MIKKLALLSALLLPVAAAFAGETVDEGEKPFVKKRYTIEGSAKIETIDGESRLVFSEDFKTKNGPDLKLYISKKPLAALSAQDVDESAVRLAVLKSHQGAQSYTLPADLDLTAYESIVIQCEAYTVLWGGFDL